MPVTGVTFISGQFNKLVLARKDSQHRDHNKKEWEEILNEKDS